MADVANIELLDPAPYELSQNDVEKRDVVYIDSPIYEVTAQEIHWDVFNIEILDQPPPPTPVAPVVSNLSPALGTALNYDDPISFDVTDENDSFRDIVVIASFPGLGLLEVIHMDTAFGPQYSKLSSRLPITNGFHYTVLRNSGWPASPTIIVKAIDTTGEENV